MMNSNVSGLDYFIAKANQCMSALDTPFQILREGTLRCFDKDRKVKEGALPSQNMVHLFLAAISLLPALAFKYTLKVAIFPLQVVSYLFQPSPGEEVSSPSNTLEAPLPTTPAFSIEKAAEANEGASGAASEDPVGVLEAAPLERDKTASGSLFFSKLIVKLNELRKSELVRIGSLIGFFASSRYFFNDFPCTDSTVERVMEPLAGRVIPISFAFLLSSIGALISSKAFLSPSKTKQAVEIGSSVVNIAALYTLIVAVPAALTEAAMIHVVKPIAFRGLELLGITGTPAGLLTLWPLIFPLNHFFK